MQIYTIYVGYLIYNKQQKQHLFLLVDDKDISESTLNGNCDNDDFHPAITPLVLAAQRNDFNTVQVKTRVSRQKNKIRVLPFLEIKKNDEFLKLGARNMF